jgi:hypothetical protein
MKRLFILLLLSMGVTTATIWATPITISYDFTFDQDPVRPGEVPVTGNVTVTLNTPAVGFVGYTSNGVVDSLDFNVTGLPGFEAAETNYVKMLFNAGKLTYLLVSDRSDFALSAISPRKAGYILGLKATDLLTGTNITVGSSGSFFQYYLNGRSNVDMAYTFDQTDIVKVANPVVGVPDTAGTFGLLGFALLGLVAFRRRILP